MSSNKLTDIPDDVLKLTRLRRLDMSNNRLSDRARFEDTLDRLRQTNTDLVVLVDGNPLD